MENFNALGQWRDKDIDAGTPIDANGKLADGSVVNGVNDLRNHMVAHAPQFMETFTENLMSYGLGRGLDYFDMPTVRAIVHSTAAEHYRFSAIVLGIVNSAAFREDEIPLSRSTATAAAGSP
jgi:hypothetical protein